MDRLGENDYFLIWVRGDDLLSKTLIGVMQITEVAASMKDDGAVVRDAADFAHEK